MTKGGYAAVVRKNKGGIVIYQENREVVKKDERTNQSV